MANSYQYPEELPDVAIETFLSLPCFKIGQAMRNVKQFTGSYKSCQNRLKTIFQRRVLVVFFLLAKEFFNSVNHSFNMLAVLPISIFGSDWVCNLG
ncbi:MAG TPA: hypothetical protein DCX78_01180 [Nitrospina sp.]|nr:hypothetical protein [Nitrospina sp.]